MQGSYLWSAFSISATVFLLNSRVQGRMKINKLWKPKNPVRKVGIVVEAENKWLKYGSTFFQELGGCFRSNRHQPRPHPHYTECCRCLLVAKLLIHLHSWNLQAICLPLQLVLYSIIRAFDSTTCANFDRVCNHAYGVVVRKSPKGKK